MTKKSLNALPAESYLIQIHADEIRPLSDGLTDAEVMNMTAQVMDRMQEEDTNTMDHNTIKKDTNHTFHVISWKTILAACLTLALIVPTGAFAAIKLSAMYQNHISNNGYESSIALENTTASPGCSSTPGLIYHADANTVRLEQYIRYAGVTTFVKLNYDLKELGDDYYLATKETDSELDESTFYANHWFRSKQGDDAEKDLRVSLYYVNDQTTIKDQNRENFEELIINGYNAFYSEEYQNSMYPSFSDDAKTLYVFYDDLNYYLRFDAMKNISKEKLISLAKTYTIEKTDRKQADEFWLVKTSSEEDSTANQSGAQTAGENTVVPTQILPATNKVTVDGLRYHIKNVEIRNSIKGLDTQSIIEQKENSAFIDLLCDKNGTFKKYQRETLQLGDGINTPASKVIDTKTIQPKLVYLTIEVENTSDQEKNTADIYSEQIKPDPDKKDVYWYSMDTYNRPYWLDQNMWAFQPFYYQDAVWDKNKDWVVRIPAKTTQTLHVGFLVDEDETDQCFLRISKGYYDDSKFIGDLYLLELF